VIARDRQGRWLRGQSPNPAGRPAGARHKATLAAEALLAGEAEALVRKWLDMAQDGDPTAMKLVVERLYPAPKVRPAPPIEGDVTTPQGVVAVLERILQQVLAGELVPEEGQRMAALAATAYQAQRAVQVQRLEELMAQLNERLDAARPATDLEGMRQAADGALGRPLARGRCRGATRPRLGAQP
jgi:hypothetical protein